MGSSDAKRVLSFEGVTRRRGQGYLLVVLSMIMLFGFLFRTARNVVINEVRSHAMGVAMATAAGIDPADIGMVWGPEDMERIAFKRVQRYLQFISESNHDVRYIYTMRRAKNPGARESDYVFVIDQPAIDSNENGVIDPDEDSELPGNAYDAADLPELIAAWHRPAADFDITADPPYPDLISGYAPIRNSKGQTVAIVGVDITAATVRSKLTAIRVALFIVGLITTLLVITVLQLYYQQREALEHIRTLRDKLADRNVLLRAANDELAAHNAQFERELKLAQNVQQGFLPTHFPRPDRITFDNFYLSCDILGGDLFDVFSVGQEHVGMYIADVAGHGVSAAMISSLLKMAFQSVRERTSAKPSPVQADLMKPEAVLEKLNDLLAREIPDYEFITMLYAVLDLRSNTFTAASAGHPPPFHYVSRRKATEMWDLPKGTALGLTLDQSYCSSTIKAEEGDKILFYTDGLPEAMNKAKDEFGEQRARDIFAENAARSGREILAAVRAEVDAHREGYEVSDDFSMLLAEIRPGPSPEARG